MRQAAADLTISYQDSHSKEIQKHYIKKGDMINCFPILAGNDSAIWKELEKFNPDRENLEKIKPLTLPFASRVHRCPGEKAAEYEFFQA